MPRYSSSSDEILLPFYGCLLLFSFKVSSVELKAMKRDSAVHSRNTAWTKRRI